MPGADSPDAVRIIQDPAAARTLLSPTRARILRTLDEPDSAAGLARRLRLPRQKVNYHLRELEALGLVELVEERKVGNCIERRVRAVARTFVLSPRVLGALGHAMDGVQPEGGAGAALAAAKVLRDLAPAAEGFRGAAESAVATVRFASAEAEAEFLAELRESLGSLAEKHGATAGAERRLTLIVSDPGSAAGRLPAPRALDS